MRYLIVLISLFVFVGCSTKKINSSETSDIGLWQGKVQMSDHKTNHKKWVSVNWASDSSVEKMRIDVYAIMDIPLATFIKVGSESHLWLFTEQKYYYSNDGEKLFSFLTKINLNPDVFYSLLGRPRPPNKQWTCGRKEGEFNCLSSLDKIKLSVDDSEGDKRVIKIKKEGKTLNLRLNRTKVEVQDENFELLSTSQFKTIRI